MPRRSGFALMGQRDNFFFHFYAFQSILSRLRHTFFSKIFVSAMRETRPSEAREMRAQSAKPEGAKRPSSPAGLAGRSAERACKLVWLKISYKCVNDYEFQISK